jgi:hypothetical protein
MESKNKSETLTKSIADQYVQNHIVPPALTEIRKHVIESKLKMTIDNIEWFVKSTYIIHIPKQ